MMSSLSKIRNLGVIALLLCSGVGAQAEPQPNGWLMKQTSDEQGLLETKVTAKAIRLDTEDVTLLLLPPTYSCYMYNKANKRYVDIPAKEFTIHTSNRPHPKFDLKKMGDTDMCGLKATKYVSFVGGKPSFEFWATKAFPIPEKLADACMIFMSITEMPPGHGLPLRASRISETGGRFTHIRTKSIERAYFPPDTFAKPKNYKLVDNFVALRTGSTNVPAPSAHALDYMLDKK
jgi:hypothetical protein